MAKVGILVHCRHLDTIGWQDLVFGRPKQDQLGDQATLVRVILDLPEGDEVACIVFGRGPSYRDGLNEGSYSKKFLLDNLDKTSQFPLLQPLLAKNTRDLRSLVEEIIITPEIQNTIHEIKEAAKTFVEHDVQKVIQICAASHAPRCLRDQSIARSNGVIDKSQLWFTVATDICYADTKPEHVCVIEPLHRRDQPLTFVRPGLSEVIVPYYSLADSDRRDFIKLVADFMAERNTLP